MSEQTTPLHTKWTIAFAIGAGGSIAVLVLLLAFLWPTKTASAHDIPVSVVGPASSVSMVEEALAEKASGTFEFVEATDRQAAVDQIETRQTYGAIVLGSTVGQLPEVLTAPAASPVVSQLLNGVASGLQAQLAQQVAAAGGDASKVVVTVTPIVPLSEADANGSGLAAAAFPLAFGGMLGGVLISLLVIGAVRRLLAVLGFSIASGLLVALVLQTWFGYLQGDFAVNALALGLAIAAMTAFIVGCTSLMGRPGIAVGGVVTMLFANPLAAATMPYQFLAEPWGQIGQLMVPGAAAWLLRSLSYFPDAPTASQWTVLLVWLGIGIVLTLIGHFRARATMHVPAASIEEGIAITGVHAS
ncbi:MAG: hypothetical protein ACOYBP_00520 [Microbacteriaceae bacterium]